MIFPDIITALVLAAADWVKYYCIPFDTEVGVKYMALYCDKYEKTPLASEPHGKSIICHTIIHLPHGQKKFADSTRNTSFVMACDILGDVLVPDIALVNSCIKKGFLKAQVQISFDLNNDWPCRLFAVIANGSVKQIDWEEINAKSKDATNEFNPPTSEINSHENRRLNRRAEQEAAFNEYCRKVPEIYRGPQTKVIISDSKKPEYSKPAPPVPVETRNEVCHIKHQCHL
ncbi:unnamed protein product [Gongylonema pulchrum]|uniref:MULE domain-containing protein n=1 Tax=Gongylonema pulchrum TaxID=637853 RepID=A0A183D344_9BILA|nr:unnamed protein product [Gongylonema pulchrum]